MKKRSMVVTVVGALLGFLCAALAIAAEAERVQDVKFDPRTFKCIYPSSAVGILAVASAGVLLLAQVIIQGSAGCICCINKRGRPTGVIAWIVFIFSWISFVVAMFLLLRVASVYGYGRRYGSKPIVQGVSLQICFIIKPGVAASGAALALISVLLGIVYFHTVERLMKETEMQEEQFPREIPMAQAQLPQEPPVFVHEDTYNRRQMP